MTRTTLVHDPVAGDRVEVFLRVTDIWMIVDDALQHVQDLDELEEVRAVHECLDPLGMPDGPAGPVWSVPPEQMWRLVERRRRATGPGRWLTEAVNRVRATLLEEFPELAATDHVDETLDNERATAAVVTQLGGTAGATRDPRPVPAYPSGPARQTPPAAER